MREATRAARPRRLGLVALALVSLFVGSFFLLRDRSDVGTPPDVSVAIASHFTVTPLPATEPTIYAQVIERDLNQLAKLHDAQLAPPTDDGAPHPIACIELDVMSLRVYPLVVLRGIWGPAIVDVLVDSRVMRLRREAAGILAVFRYDEAIECVHDAFVDALAAGDDVVPYLRALHDMIARCDVAPMWGEDLAEDLLGLVETADAAVGFAAAQCLESLAHCVDRDWSHESEVCFLRFPMCSVAIAGSAIARSHLGAIGVVEKGLVHGDLRVRLRSVLLLQHRAIDGRDRLDGVAKLLSLIFDDINEGDVIRRESLIALWNLGYRDPVEVALASPDEWARSAAQMTLRRSRVPASWEGDDLQRNETALPDPFRESVAEFLQVLGNELQVECDVGSDWRDKGLGDPMRQIISDLMEVIQPR